MARSKWDIAESDYIFARTMEYYGYLWVERLYCRSAIHQILNPMEQKCSKDMVYSYYKLQAEHEPPP